MLLRARARPRPRDGGRPPRRHAAALDDPVGRPRRRAPGDPRGDQHARGLARGPGARRLHRDAVARTIRSAARSSARSTTIRAATRDSVRASTGATTCPGELRGGGAGNVRHDEAARAARRPHGRSGRALRSAGPIGDGTLRSTARAPAALGRDAGRRRKTRAGPHLPRHERAAPGPIPDRFAFLIVNTALGGGMSSRLFQEIREKRGLAYSVVQLPLAVHRGRLVHRVRGHDARRARDEVIGAAPPRARRRASTAGSPRRSSSARKGHVKGRLVLSPRGSRGPDVASRASPRSRTARS